MPASTMRELVALARKARKTAQAAGTAQRAWADAFEARYGHRDISDALVEMIDYGMGADDELTAKYIEANSKPDRS